MQFARLNIGQWKSRPNAILDGLDHLGIQIKILLETMSESRFKMPGIWVSIIVMF